MTPIPSLQTLNTEVRVLMIRRGKRQGDLAEALGITQSQVARRLSGEIEWKFTELAALAAVLDLALPDLVALAAVDQREQVPA